ncbi:uncharacterized protein LOC129912755 [Episyrphus balteatus]|uniref:uncharacterized protein LOC129912755 n=1 Tax=Episyrphus balteatus TaxID=286459 RepID=UPI002486781E|nr:uncharacterized protein LOC129912755 [Episyrphus balteatus]
MAQNFLYMFEFVVDDLLITRPNMCAPEEYPTCCELTFRSHVFVSICDKEFGGCIDTARKSGKCCLFSLETPIMRTDRLQLHVFKKRTDQCKFLIGATEIPVHRMFDKVTDDFYARNPNWNAHLKNPKANARSSISKKNKVVIDNDCGAADSSATRKEELCPTYELSKKLLALSNMSGGLQTGNIVLIMRLACMGPTIVSPFLFGKPSPSSCCPKVRAPCKKDEVNDATLCKRYFSSNAEKDCTCGECEDEEDRCQNKRNSRQNKSKSHQCIPNDQENHSRGCPCPDCDDECEIDENKDENYDEEEDCSDIIMKPCILCPSKPDYGSEKYDEFEANLNGSGLTIRVLKDTHVVENVCDIEPDDDDIEKCSSKKGKPANSKICADNLNDLVQNYSLARNHIERRIGGNIINNKSLPMVRGNIKYSGNDSCCGDSINIPLLNKLPPIKSVDAYRKTPSDIRNCCFQVEANDIDSTLRGINAAAKKKGIEVCHTFDDPDTDVFLVKLGNKKSAQNKKNMIEIELRTPKEPLNIRAQKWTKETQVDEQILDANLKNRKRKGKKGSRKNRCF